MAKRYKELDNKQKKEIKKTPSKTEEKNNKGKHEKEEIKIKQEEIQPKKDKKIKQKTKDSKLEKNKKQQKIKKKEEKEKVKQREKRIEEKKKEKQKEDFEYESDVAIRMIMKNNRDKKEQQKQKIINKKKKRIKRTIKLIILILLIIGAIIFALTSPIFNIKNIEVINNKQVSTENVISLSGITEEQNIFKFLKVNIENSIKQNAYVENIEIKRMLPNKIQIKVNERIKSFSIEFLGGYAVINNQGYILEIVEDRQELPNIKGIKTAPENISIGNRLNNEDLEELEPVIKIMNICKDNNLDSKVTYIDISDKNEYIIYMESENKIIHIGDKINLSNKMIYVQSMINENKNVEGEIFVNGDLNNKFKPYFREKV